MSWPGWWVSPKGDVQLVATTHVAEIIRRPGEFGFTKDGIHDAYEKYDERLGIEGKARRELIIDAVKRGWVRIRKYRNHFSVTVGRLDDQARKNLEAWANSILDGTSGFVELGRYAEVRVLCVEGEELVVMSLGELTSVVKVPVQSS